MAYSIREQGATCILLYVLYSNYAFVWIICCYYSWLFDIKIVNKLYCGRINAIAKWVQEATCIYAVYEVSKLNINVNKMFSYN